ncbi:MAG: bifunctional oligoribonuclease/PAP phosphatase NrnA [Bacteroidales bacterium]|nr:bifunctional oligoribonuclease/PAP phosphatase NrnA [Bacteroidales bacterium]
MRVVVAEDRLNGLIQRSSNVVLFGHENPDGDSIGSCMAMYRYLEGLGRRAHIIINSRLPEYFSFLIPEGVVSYYTEAPEDCERLVAGADLLVFLDMNGADRAGGVAKAVEKARKGDVKPAMVLIDHHLNPKAEEFDIVISDTEVSSACELLYQVLLSQPGVAGDVNKLSLECAKALFTGILTDTNNFANSVYPSTYMAVSALQGRGVDRDAIFNHVFRSYSQQRMRLMGHMLQDNMRCIAHGVAYFTLSRRTKEEFGFVKGDSEGFVNLPLAIKDIKMTAFFTEEEDYIKVSLRSKGDIDVNEFSRRYCNGGGHRNASGGRLYMPMEEVPAYFESKVNEYFAG